MKQIHVVFYFLIILLSISCSKKEAVLTNTDLLSRAWQTDEVIFVQGLINGTVYKKGANNNVLDFSKIRFTFRANGSVEGIDQDGNTGVGNWSFANNETQILIKGGNTDPVTTLMIARLTASNLDFSQVRTVQGQGAITVTIKMIPL